MDLANKVVLITGASSGIGAACAIHFAKLSAKLSLVGRVEENLIKTANQCEAISKIKPLTILGDISKDEDVENIVEKTVKQYGAIDVLVNNAGISGTTSTRNGISVFDRVMATNLRGTYLLTGKCIPHLIKTKGCIITISSILSTSPNPDLAAYCMSKAALDMFTKCLALELGPKGVRANTVNPGTVDTDIFRRSGMSAEHQKHMFKIIKDCTPLRKAPQTEDIAELVTFLASNKANCITGNSYVIDCGLASAMKA